MPNFRGLSESKGGTPGWSGQPPAVRRYAIVSCTLFVATVPPAVLVTVTVYVPGLAFVVGEIVNLVLPVPATAFGTNVQFTLPGKPEMVKMTLPVKLVAVVLTVREADPLRAAVSVAALKVV